LSIAQYGYRTAGAERLSLVFYPLYPALVRLFHSVVPDYFLAGMVVSNLSLLVALYFLVRLAEVEWQNTEAAHASAMYAVVFPFSFFFSIVYTESVFVMLCILSFYCLRKNKWLAAGFFGMLAALTRNQGLLLAIPIAIEAALDWRSIRQLPFRRALRRLLPKLAAAALPAVGIFLYLCINKWVSGDWFRFLSYQREHWQQRIGFFADNLYDTVYRTIYWHSPPYALGIWIPEAVLFFASFALLIYMTNKTRLSGLAFSFAYLLISFSPTGLLSGARYAGGLFTLYLYMGRASLNLPRVGRMFLQGSLLFLLLFYSVLFSLGFVF
jgi:Gpi18-like mannosyltransferase